MNYDEQLSNAIQAWNTGDVEDEWQFQRLREACIGAMPPEVAFRSVDPTVDQLLTQDSEMTATEVMETLLALAIRSQTTEVPNRLKEALDLIDCLFARFGDYAKDKWTELKRYYGLGTKRGHA
jgi:hypothetical protein